MPPKKNAELINRAVTRVLKDHSSGGSYRKVADIFKTLCENSSDFVLPDDGITEAQVRSACERGVESGLYSVYGHGRKEYRYITDDERERDAKREQERKYGEVFRDRFKEALTKLGIDTSRGYFYADGSSISIPLNVAEQIYAEVLIRSRKPQS